MYIYEKVKVSYCKYKIERKKTERDDFAVYEINQKVNKQNQRWDERNK